MQSIKKMLLILSLVVLVGCAIVVPPQTVTYTADVRVYNVQGFVITPAADIIRPIALLVKYLYFRRSAIQLMTISPFYIPLQDAIKKLVDNAKLLGANSIINFKVENIEKLTYCVSGFAIYVEPQP